MADSKIKDLAEIPKGIDPSVKKVLQSFLEALQVLRSNRGDPLDGAVTWRDALSTGLVKPRGNGYQAAAVPGGAGSPGVSGPPGPAGPSYTPDLTPPPTVAGLSVSAGLTNIIVQFTAPTYTTGHGNQRTDIYAVKRDPASGAPAPTFGDASVVTSVAGASPIIAIPSNLNVEWHVWAKHVSNDGVASTSPAGGTNGAVATTGKIGNTDLGALIVEAGNLANGSVGASKLAALAVDLTKFANGIEPMAIVSAVPSTLSTKMVFNTTDGKVYRWNGTAYTRAVDGADITANSIVAGMIQAGAIGTTQLAAGAVTTGKLLVTGQGKALNDDPATMDLSAWNVAVGAISIVTGAGAPIGTSAMRVTASGGGGRVASRFVPVEPGKTYKVAVYLRQNSGGGNAWVRLECTDAAGVDQGHVLTASQPVGLTNLESLSLGAGWTRYVGSIVAPAGCVKAALDLYTNWPGGSGVVDVTDFRCEEYIGADLIVDGAIVAGKLAAGAIAVGTAAIQNGAIVNAMIGNAVIDDAKMANVSVAKLLAGSLAVGEYMQSTGYVPGVSGWRITGNGAAEFSFAMIRGTLQAGQIAAGYVNATMIDSRGLNIRDAAGNVILSSGTPLANQITAGSGNLYQNTEFALSTAAAPAPASGNMPAGFAIYNNSGVAVTSAVGATTGFDSANSGYWSLTPGSNATANFGFFLNGGWAGWQQNVDYVWSFYARVPLGGNSIGGIFADAWNNSPASATWLQNPPLTTSWQRYVVKINFGSNTVDSRGFITVDSSHFPNSGVRIDFSCIQIEKGTAPSGWKALTYVDGSGVLRGTAGAGTSVDNNLLTSSIVDKLSKSVPSILSSTVSINATSGAGFVAGNLTWDAGGNVLGGHGVAMTPGGLVGVNSSGVKTFSVDASTGNAFFGGTLAVGTASKTGASGAQGTTTLTGSSQSTIGSNVTVISSGVVTNTGADVSYTASANIYVDSSTACVFQITMAPTVDGVAQGLMNPSTVMESQQTPSGTRAAQIQLSGAWRFPVSAGTHSYGVTVTVTFYSTSSTASIAPTTTHLTVFAIGTAQENLA